MALYKPSRVLTASLPNGRDSRVGLITTMKKKYILPSLRMTAMVAESLMAASDPNDVVVNKNGSVEAAEVDVKGASYNVWNDDWSE